MDGDFFNQHTPHIVIIQQRQDDEDMSDLPPLEAGTSHTTSVDIPDVDMRAYDNDNDDVPDLQSISSSDSESDRDADEVEMQAVDNDADTDEYSDPPLPHVEPVTYTPPRSVNRRVRVEDDEDEERDRRHPSERIHSPINVSNVSTPSSNSPWPQSHPPTSTALANNRQAPSSFNISNRATGSNTISQPSQNPQSTNTATGDGARNLPVFGGLPSLQDNAPGNPFSQFFTGGISISIDIDNQPDGENVIGVPNQPHGHDRPFHGLPNPFAQQPSGQPQAQAQMGQPIQQPTFGDLLGMRFLGELFGIEPDIDDPGRAKKLIEGLEEVPLGLVRRLERIGVMNKAGGVVGHPSNDDLSGGDSGCAICWEKLLIEDQSGGFGLEKPDTQGQDAVADCSASSSSDDLHEIKIKYPKIVTLPCAHIFHASCLVPWFSRPKQTTCPTCRFNIDPDDLTFVPYRQRQRQRTTETDPGDASATSTVSPDANVDLNSNAATAENQNTNAHPMGGDIMSAIFGQSIGQEDNDADAVERVIPIEVVRQPLAGQEQTQRQAERQPSDPVGSTSNHGLTNTPPPFTPIRRAGSEPPANRIPAPVAGLGQAPRFNPGNHGIRSIPVAGGGTLFGPFFVPVQVGPNGESPVRNFMPVQAFNRPIRLRHAPAQGQPNLQPQQLQRDPPIFLSPVPPFAQVAQPDGAAHPIPTALGRGGPAHPNPPQAPLQPQETVASNGSRFPALFGGSVDIQVSEFDWNPVTGSFTARDSAPQHQQEQQSATQPEVPQQQQAPQANPTVWPTTVPRAHVISFPPFSAVAGLNLGGHQRGVPPNVGALIADAWQRALVIVDGTPNVQGDVEQPQTQPQTQPQQQQHSQPQPAQQDTHQHHPLHTLFPNLNQMASVAPPPHGVPPLGQDEEGMFDSQQMATFLRQPAVVARMLMSVMGGRGGAGLGSTPHPTTVTPPVKQEWTPPPAPGPTLRQRIEKREREAGLRCFDMSCGVGPSDEDPYVDDVGGFKQLFIRSMNLNENDVREEKKGEGRRVCAHTFHSSCLVSAERVALRGADKLVVGDDVEVSCPICRGIGCVSKEEWNEGVSSLI